MGEDRLHEALARLGRRYRLRPGWEERIQQAIIAPRGARRERSTWLAFGVMASLAMVCAILAVFSYQKSQSEESALAEARMKASALADYQKEAKALEQNQAEQDALLEKYRAAATEQERTALEDEIAAKRRQASTIAARLDTAKKKAGAAPDRGGRRSKDQTINVTCDPNDPLCGL